MKATFEITKARMEGIACCIVDNGMDRDEACDYAVSVLNECADDELVDADFYDALTERLEVKR